MGPVLRRPADGPDLDFDAVAPHVVAKFDLPAEIFRLDEIHLACFDANLFAVDLRVECTEGVVARIRVVDVKLGVFAGHHLEMRFDVHPFDAFHELVSDVGDVLDKLRDDVLDIVVPIEAGRGVLLRASNEYLWRGHVNLKGDVTVPENMTLTIAAGCTVQVFNDTDKEGVKSGGLVVNESSGGLRINPSGGEQVVFMPGYHSKAERAKAECWQGIRITGVNLDRSRYIIIRNCKMENTGRN